MRMFYVQPITLFFSVFWVIILTVCTPTCALNVTELDCRMRVLALKYAHSIQPWRHRSQIEKRAQSMRKSTSRNVTTTTETIEAPDGDILFTWLHDALQLTQLCHIPPPLKGEQMSSGIDTSLRYTSMPWMPPPYCQINNKKCYYVNPNVTFQSNDDCSWEHPCSTIHQALVQSRRRHSRRTTSTIVLRDGIHTLEKTLLLQDPMDNGLTIIGYPGEHPWISGGLLLRSNHNPHETSTIDSTSDAADENIIVWKPWRQSTTSSHEIRKKKKKAGDMIYVTDLSKILQPYDLPKVPALFTTHARFIRARYPNSNPEVTQWGYNSPDKLNYSLPVTNDLVLEWHVPAPGPPPIFDYFDASSSSSLYPKNDSTMDGYNIYASGSGGVCASIWGSNANSYWCSNASAGGWAEVDQECAMTGRMQLPTSLQYNVSQYPIGQRLASWNKKSYKWNTNNSTTIITNTTTATISKGTGGRGGYVYAWHSQSWAMHMFEIDPTTSVPGWIAFRPGGGRQGGRNWCRCDQCTYAGSFCHQHDPPSTSANSEDDDKEDEKIPYVDRRLISGTWLIEHVLEELDIPGEFYFDSTTRHLYLYPNSTTSLNEPPTDLRFAMLETLIDIRDGAHNITLENIGFRDTAPTFFGDWSAPSGGDWALHRGGAIFLEGVSNITIRDCTFSRLDGTAIFLSKWTSHVIIQRNLFEWIGENAIATWGDTDGYNATLPTQPMHTLVEHNVMRELGLFQKQSSAWGQAKAALSTIRNNIMFNMPRAAINFNDHMGGGDAVYNNLIFNTCRESGDHGPINTWDRQPFLTTLRDGALPSFSPLPRIIAHNFIIANYGASQGVDNDDGSSWYHIHHNVFYDAEGFKMDYGGHDSIYEDNVVISYPSESHQKCIGFASFFPGHGHIVRRNKCVVPDSQIPISSLVCQTPNTVTVSNNQYYSPNGTVLMECWDIDGTFDFNDYQQQFGLEMGSTVQVTPTIDDMLTWSRELLFQNASNLAIRPKTLRLFGIDEALISLK